MKDSHNAPLSGPAWGASPEPGADEAYALPVSLGQKRFLALDRIFPGNPAYNVAVRFRLSGLLNAEILERAFNEIVRRHETLRTSFGTLDGNPVQLISPHLKLCIPVTDLRTLSEPDAAAESNRRAVLEAQQRFDLKRAPLIRAGLLRLGEEEHVLLVTAHHAVCDGWSIGLITDELGALYTAYSKGEESPLPEFSLQYADFAVWQAQWLAGHSLDPGRTYWLERLKNLASFDLRTDHPRPVAQTFDGNIVSSVLSRSLTDALTEFGNRHNSTLFVTALAALKTLLSRYSGQTDIAVGTQVAGRDRVELEGLIGLFINTLVLRTDVSGDPIFTQLLGRVGETVLEALAHQEFPFELLLDQIPPKGDPRSGRLFRVNFILQRDFVRPLQCAGLNLTAIPSKCQGALYDLNFFMVERADGWRASCEYNTGLFDEATAIRMLEDFQAVLEGIVENSDRPLSAFPLRGKTGGAAFEVARLKPNPENDPSPRPGLTATPAQPNAESQPSGSVEVYAFPATLAQRRFWMLDQLSPGTSALNMPAGLLVEGALDVSLLERSLDAMMARHEALRTGFEIVAGVLSQVIASNLTLALEIHDLQTEPKEERERKTQQLFVEAVRKPFNLSQRPLFRVCLIRQEPERHVLLFIFHHIISDGWSGGVFVREFWKLYQAFKESRPSPLAPVPLQYADFAVWQQQWLQSQDFHEDLAFWQARLHGRLPVLNIPTDRPSRVGPAPAGGIESIVWPRTLTERLKQFCQRESVTMFMLCLAAFKTLLHRYCGQEEILIGSPTANRTPETEGLMGLFSHPLCLRTDLSGSPTFRQLLERVREVTADALAHKDVPFEKVVDGMAVHRTLGRSPLFQFYFAYQVAFMQSLELPGLKLTPLRPVSPGANFELHLAIIELREGVRAQLEFNAELFDDATARRMLGHYQTLLEAAVSDPESYLWQLPLLTEPERQRLLPEASPARPSPADGKTLPALLAETAGRFPDAIALLTEDNPMSYGELDRHSSRLARRLKHAGVEPGARVGLDLEQPSRAAVGFLGILKAGGICVPLDPTFPEVVWHHILEEAELAVVVTCHAGTTRLATGDLKRIFVEEEEMPLLSVDEGDASVDLAGDRPAGLFYESEQDGKLVGILLSHQALVRRAGTMADVLELKTGDRVALVHSPASTLAWEEIVSCIVAGASLIPFPGGSPAGKPPSLACLEKHRPTVLSLSTQARWDLVDEASRQGRLEAFDSLRLVLTEHNHPLFNPPPKCRGLTPQPVRIIGRFGAGEAGGIAAWREAVIRPEESARSEPDLDLGQPAGGNRLLVLDSHLQPVAAGVSGEICIAGDSLFSGYFKRQDLTRSRSLPNPLDQGRSQIFRTNHRARYRADGRIDYLGRGDRHLLVEGLTVEVGEIEAWLRRFPGIRDALITQVPNAAGEPRIVAYIVAEANGNADPRAIQLHLKRRFPEQLAPSALVPLRAFPRTWCGELDLTALPQPGRDQPETVRTEAPRNQALELGLTRIWEKVLRRSPIGVRDNFFDLGGSSMLAVQLFVEIEKVLGKKLPLATLFRAPTVEALAGVLESGTLETGWRCLVPIREAGSKPPLFLIHGAEGNVLIYRQLAEHLGPEQPVYGIQSQGLDGRGTTRRTFEEMASHYVTEIRTVQPEGPYYLGGYCLGGTLALEMARQLEAAGQKTALVSMFETYNLGAIVKPHSRWLVLYRSFQKVKFHAQNFLAVGSKDQWAFLREKVRVATVRMKHRIAGRIQTGSAIQLSVRTANDRAQFGYVPQPYSGPVALFRPKTYFVGEEDPKFGWGPLLSGGLTVHILPLYPKAMMVEPFVRTLASSLQETLKNRETPA
jgi:non-ribosomal peptide synthetase component F/thioesterase domain-containing protein/acyl carrier protein